MVMDFELDESTTELAEVVTGSSKAIEIKIITSVYNLVKHNHHQLIHQHRRCHFKSTRCPVSSPPDRMYRNR